MRDQGGARLRRGKARRGLLYDPHAQKQLSRADAHHACRNRAGRVSRKVSAADAGEPTPEALAAALDTYKVAAVLFEIVRGEGGVLPLEKSFVDALEKEAAAHDFLLMCDEVQCGNGRSGTLYAYMQYGLSPDVVTTAKGLGGGLPLGATLLGDKAADLFTPGSNGSTFGGNPICAAAALNVISRLNEDVFAGVKGRAAYIRKELTGAPGVKSITGLGLMIGILPENKTAAEVASACLQDGLMVLTAHEKVRLLPPLNISYEDLAAGLAILKKHLA